MRGRTFDDLRFILLAGGSLNMSARGWREEQLRFLAVAAGASAQKPRLILRDIGALTSNQLRFIAMAGRGRVVFSDEGDQ